MQHKALIVTDFWATVIGGVLSLAIISGFAFAIGLASRTDVLASQMDELRRANLPTDMATVKESVNDIESRLTGQQRQLDNINAKLDYLIQNRPSSRQEARSHQ